MSWWIIGLALWLCPALLVGMALLVVARRSPSTPTQASMGFWRDAQAEVWTMADAEAAAHSAPGAALAFFERDLRWPTLELEPQAVSVSGLRPLLPPLPPAPAPSGP